MSQPSPHPKPPQSTPLGPPDALGGGSDERRLFAAMAYVLPVVGGVIGLAADGSNPLTRHHAQQSIGAVVTAIASFLAWAVCGYLIGLIPIFGPIVSIALFALVIAMAIFLGVNWLFSLVSAARGLEREIPLANRIVARLFGAVEKTGSIISG